MKTNCIEKTPDVVEFIMEFDMESEDAIESQPSSKYLLKKMDASKLTKIVERKMTSRNEC